MRIFIFIFILLLALTSGVAEAQTAREDSSWIERISGDVWNGAGGVTKWYDTPLALVFLARNYYKADNEKTKIIFYPAMPFEQRIADDIGVTDGYSFGSMNIWIIPGIILGSRLAWAIGNNIAGTENMSEEYAHAWTFSRVLMYNYLTTELVKNTVRRTRPDQSDTKSLFSGHVSSAFVTSAFVYREVDDMLDETMAQGMSRDAIKVASFGVLYGWAAYVGYCRMVDNKHYLVDVLVAAAVGSLFGNLIHDYYFGQVDGNPPSDNPPSVGFGIIDEQPVLSFSLKF
ncbi:MAG: phosphatase PAP2 family protein [Bacteroidota bacterium]|jgi:membrane-associated phospholipid phosphatase